MVQLISHNFRKNGFNNPKKNFGFVDTSLGLELTRVDVLSLIKNLEVQRAIKKRDSELRKKELEKQEHIEYLK